MVQALALQRVSPARLSDQLPSPFVDQRSSRLFVTNLPGPEHSEAFVLSSDDRRWFEDYESGPPDGGIDRTNWRFVTLSVPGVYSGP